MIIKTILKNISQGQALYPSNMKKLIIWLVALVAGIILGLLQIDGINKITDIIATIYTRLFQFLAIPTIVLAIISTLAKMGNSKNMGRMFKRTVTYTLLTTTFAAIVGGLLYISIEPHSIEVPTESTLPNAIKENTGYLDHILNIVPNNIVTPFLEGNILTLLILAFAIGMALSHLPDSNGKSTVVNFFLGMQEILFKLINWLVWTLPLGIVAFSAQLANELTSGSMVNSLGTYVITILVANTVQFFIVLPLFLLARRVNPIKTFKGMIPAVLMALFTKSSVATLPVTIDAAESRLGVNPEVSRFVLPICTTINMNGCAAFILVTSLFVMSSGDFVITPTTIILWLLIAVISAVGNAGVPMGCYFITFSLMSGIGAPVAILGLILPIYTVIDMIETAENVWSDSCVCVMTDHDFKTKPVE